MIALDKVFRKYDLKRRYFIEELNINNNLTNAVVLKDKNDTRYIVFNNENSIKSNRNILSSLSFFQKDKVYYVETLDNLKKGENLIKMIETNSMLMYYNNTNKLKDINLFVELLKTTKFSYLRALPFEPILMKYGNLKYIVQSLCFMNYIFEDLKENEISKEIYSDEFEKFLTNIDRKDVIDFIDIFKDIFRANKDLDKDFKYLEGFGEDLMEVLISVNLELKREKYFKKDTRRNEILKEMYSDV